MDVALRTQRGWVAQIGDTTAGFVTVIPCFPETWEITWLAVAPDQHRQGVGRRLVETVIDACRAADVELLLVKTLADEHPSPEYAQTRAFYRRLGFLPLNVLPQVWGEDNPCLLMVRPLS